MRDLSREAIGGLTTSRTNAATRFHRIDFSDPKVSETGFGINHWEEYDDDAWQFSLSVNEHGRVHGFLIENVFYVVWFDPQHQLYS